VNVACDRHLCRARFGLCFPGRHPARELGVRLAFGSAPGAIAGLMFRQVLALIR